MIRNMLSAINPLRCKGTGLPPVLVLIARSLAIVLIIRGEEPFGRYLPYFEFIDTLGTPDLFNETLRGMAIAGYILLFFTPLARSGCLLVGAAFMIGLIGCRPCLSVAHTYVAAVFLILALSSHASGTWLLRLQVVVLYAGACLNKVLDADWWNGQYFETLMLARHHHGLYAKTAALFPPMIFSTIMGIMTIFTQLALSICFLRRPWYIAGILLGLIFHGVMVMLINSTFGPFFMAVAISYVAFIEWPERIDVAAEGSRWKHRLKWVLTAIDFDSTYRFLQPGDAAPNRLEIVVNGRRYGGFAAFQRLLFYSPISFFVVAYVMAETHLGHVRSATMILLAVFFSPFLARLIDALRNRASALP